MLVLNFEPHLVHGSLASPHGDYLLPGVRLGVAHLYEVYKMIVFVFKGLQNDDKGLIEVVKTLGESWLGWWGLHRHS